MSLAATSTPQRPAHLPIRKPTSTEELRNLVGRAITALRRIHAAEAKRQARIDYYQQKIEDLKQQSLRQRDEQLAIIRRIMPRVYEYIEANRFELTNRDTRKSVAFPDGSFKWQAVRYTDLPKDREEEFFREVRGLNLASLFIRTKEEPNRAALLEPNNREQAQKITSARVVDETRPQLVTPGTTLRIERVKGKEEGAFQWDVVDTRNR
jgi:phage host-nuclease inhibitor protein Gam